MAARRLRQAAQRKSRPAAGCHSRRLLARHDGLGCWDSATARLLRAGGRRRARHREPRQIRRHPPDRRRRDRRARRRRVRTLQRRRHSQARAGIRRPRACARRRRREFQRFLFLPDPTPVHIVLATAIANRIPEGDPVWVVTSLAPAEGRQSSCSHSTTSPACASWERSPSPACSPAPLARIEARTRAGACSSDRRAGRARRQRPGRNPEPAPGHSRTSAPSAARRL